jgi:dTDP-glucose 4,6-dehydratase/UDP-glucuronate decarboxylase
VNARCLDIIREDASRVADALGARLRALEGASLLVTGAGGFLCSNLLDVVAAWNDRREGRPCRVIAVDNFASGWPARVAHLAGRHELSFLRQDVCRPLELAHPVDFLVHGASIASPPAYRARPLETLDVNVAGTRQCLELARRGARSMLFLSSSEIYGDPTPDAIPTPESYRGSVSCTGPRACYDEGKRVGETLCSIYHREYGTPVKIARPFNVYGPGQRLDDGRILPDLIGAALERRPLLLRSDGSATRAFCYASDAICALLLVLLSDADGEAVNVGNDRAECSIAELARLVREIAGPPPLEIRREASPDPDYLTDCPRRRCPDLTRLRTRFGYAPEVDLKAGLERLWRSCH